MALAVLPTSVFAALPLNLYYWIEFNEAMQYIDITASLPTDDNNELFINIPSRGVTALDIKPMFIETQDISHYIKKFSFASPTQVTFHYQLHMNNPYHHIDAPIIEEHFFQLMGISSLTLPLYRGAEDAKINIQFKNLPKNFTVVGSGGLVKSEAISFNGTLNEFSSYVLAGSDHNHVFHIGKKPVMAFSSTQQDAFPTTRMSNFETVATFQNTLMGDQDARPFLLTSVTVPEDAFHSTLFSRHFRNTISLSIPEKKNEDGVVIAFARENFRHWLGGKLRADIHHGQLLWFIGGVNDYFANSSAHQSGVISQETYIKNINNLLREYYLSPLQHQSYQQLVEKYSNDPYHNIAAQMRGNLAALMLQGNTKKPLENEPLTRVIKNLLAVKGEKDYCVLSPELLDEHLKKELSARQMKDFTRAINTGKGLKLPKTLNDNELKLKQVKVLYPKFDFDMNAFTTKHVIKNIKPDSASFKAGLRDGMEVIEYKMILHEPDKKVSIVTKINGAIKGFQFLPDTDSATIPQYVSNA